MNRHFDTTVSTPTRTLAATAALLLTAVLFGSNVGLADHYAAQAERADAAPVLVAGRG